jgi:hypothetical protein
MARCPVAVASVRVSYVGQDVFRNQKLNGTINRVKFLLQLLQRQLWEKQRQF